MRIDIREEQPGDISAIRALNELAFGGVQEARLIDALRSNGAVLLSLVATLNERIVGHNLYSPATVAGSVGAGLGPMAVHPAYQRKGIGSRLIEAGNVKLRAAGYPFIIVLGHAEYYPRFGFRPAASRGIRCQWDVPQEVFMILVLDEEKMESVAGLAEYRQEFLTVM